MKSFVLRKLLALLGVSLGQALCRGAMLGALASFLLVMPRSFGADGIDWVTTPGFPGEPSSFNHWEPYNTGVGVAEGRFQTWVSQNCGGTSYYSACSQYGPTPIACQQNVPNALCVSAQQVQPYVTTVEGWQGPLSTFFRAESWLCNIGFEMNSSIAQCLNAYFILPPPPPDCHCKLPATKASINPGSGNERWDDVDYRSGDGRLVFSRSYNGSSATASNFSLGWQSNLLGRKLVPLNNSLPYPLPLNFDPGSACTNGAAGATYLGNMQCQLASGQVVPVYSTEIGAPWDVGGISGVVAQRQDGSMDFLGCTRSSCTANPDVSIRLLPTYYSTSTNAYRLIDNDDTVEVYDGNGMLRTVTSRDGYAQSFSYNGNQLASTTDTFGRSLQYSYNAQGQLQTVTTPDGTIQYGYDASGRLSTVTYPDSSVRTYQYNDPNHSSLLTGIVDESSNAYVSTSYDALGRATQSGFAGGVGLSSVDYSDPANPVVTDPLGVARTYHYTLVNGYQKISSISGPPCPGCGVGAATTYDAAGYLASTTDWNGNLTNYIYDDSRGLESSRTEAVGSAQQRTITTTWNPNFRVPAEIDEPGRQTTFTYDSSGNLLTRTVKDTNTNASRTWTYSNYTAWGAPQTIDGPRTDASDVTQIAYYPIASGDPKSGQIDTITDALGHVTTVNSYDPSGRPLQITDPNGLVTVLGYTPRGWLASRQSGTELTQYSYYPTGLLKNVSLPDGRYLQYTYNAAHQLTQVQDQLGDRIVYTPDAMGNNTSVKVYDPNGTLVQTHSRVYNNLDELYQDISAQNKITTYGYDNNGNLTSVTDPLNHQTVKSYDALDRLSTVTDPANGLTRYAYNALDQLTGVTDPRSLATGYTVDALGNTGNVQSPDSGATGATYDAAGNVLSRTDAKNQTTQYQYDALNRPILVTYADSSTVSFSYDQGSNGIGRRTGMVDASGSTAWTYDAHGRLASKTQTVGGVALTMLYNYDANGRLQSTSNPGAGDYTYTWTNGQITAMASNGPVMNSISWQPFGGLKTYTYSSGGSETRNYDLDGRPIATGAENTISYDDASRISAIDAQRYGYDALDRLTSFSNFTNGATYTYDAAGNRLSQVTTQYHGPTVTTTYTPAADSNRLAMISSGSTLTVLQYDANGSITQDANGSYSYDAAGRLAGVSSSYSMSAPATYTYNGLGQRVKKQVGSVTTLYLYDEAQHLVGEFDSTGYELSGTLYLGDVPLRAFPQGGPYEVYSDHLNTPRLLTYASSVDVWAWGEADFGSNPADPYPSGGSYDFPVTYNPRFSGQMFDAETGLHYNMNRYYNPATGRYLESDPIGLGGGVNTYGYVGGNPISFVDGLGLRYYNAEQTNVLLAEAQYLATEGPIEGLNNIYNYSLGQYDFGWNEHRHDTWCVNGKILNADQMGNYIAGFEGASYDQAYPWPVNPAPQAYGLALQTVIFEGINFHMRRNTKAQNDPFDLTGIPDILAGAIGAKEFPFSSNDGACGCK